MAMATFSCGTMMTLGKFAPAVGVHGERFDDGREIRAGIGEHIIDAALGEPRQIGLRGNVWGFGISHRLASVLLAFPGPEG